MPYKARFRSIFHGVIDIISLIDTDYTILMVNKAYERLLKKTAEECIGKKCYKILRNRETPCEDCPILNLSTNDKNYEELSVPIGDDQVLIRRHPVYDNRGHVVGVFEIGKIVTKELRMQREIEHQGRLKIMGELAASIVHEIKNPLVGIGLMVASILERLEHRKTKSALYNDLEGILSEVQRLEKLLENLSDFGKPKIFLTKKEDIHYPINKTLRLLRRKLGSHQIVVEKAFNRKIPAIKIDSSKMQQIFLNILLNSIDAMPSGGKIIIKTDIYQTETEDKDAKSWVKVSIQDTGTGIKEEDLQYIFDPFFSRGSDRTGLGLSIVSRIIDFHNGSINIRSKEGEGTMVEICLPGE
ncbi:MAG: two-component system sensor histidine kinase NtrB [bacterium]